MKILFIIGTLSGGGAEKVVSIISSALADNHEVTVFLDKRTDKEYAISDKVRIECLPGTDSGLLKKIAYLKKIKKREHFDVAISFSPQSALCNVCSRKNELVVTSVRATTSGTTQKKQAKVLEWCCRKSDRVVTVSDYCGLDMHKNYGVDNDKLFTVYNPVDNNALEGSQNVQLDARQVEYLEGLNDKVLLSTHGRLSPEKAYCHLIRSMKQIVAKYPEVCLCIIGNGPQKDRLVSLIQELNLQDNVFLFGHTMNPYVVLQQSDVYVFSSSCEGFPNAVLDAMACDLPIVSSDCHGVHELLSPDTECDYGTDSIDYALDGILTKCFDDKWLDADVPMTFEEECFVQAVCNILEDENLKNKYIARSMERIKDFDLDKIVAEWEKVLA